MWQNMRPAGLLVSLEKAKKVAEASRQAVELVNDENVTRAQTP
jgi:hypothetical protein